MKELLLLLSNYPYNEKDKPALERAVRSVSDWKKAVNLINAHGIIALAAYNIKVAGLCDLVPCESMTILSNGQAQSLVRNVWLTQRWKEVNMMLSGAGIKHVLLKGMALEHTVYGSYGLRQMNDNDILITREDALKAWCLLKEKGFKSKMIASSWHKNILLEIDKHLPELTKDGYTLEIHHKLLSNTENTFRKINMIANSREILIEGVKAYILPDQINIAYLKEHLKYHLDDGHYQFRLSNDIRLLNNEEFPDITTNLLQNPENYRKKNFNKIKYKTQVFSISLRNRWKYILGDVFPSIAWMKQRYKCNSILSLFLYPLRLGKLLWLIT